MSRSENGPTGHFIWPLLALAVWATQGPWQRLPLAGVPDMSTIHVISRNCVPNGDDWMFIYGPRSAKIISSVNGDQIGPFVVIGHAASPA